MKLLLDTQVLLWWLMTPKRLSARVAKLIASGRTQVYVSAVTSWEIEIKRALRKLKVPADLDEQLVANRFEEIPLRARHTRLLRELPSHHQDPFDRILIAQAKVEGLTLVTADANILRYPVPTIET